MSTTAWALGLHLLTAHAAPGYESVTPGVYARHESGFTLGAYRNSIARPSAYAGWTFETSDGRYALTVGAVTGYKRRCEVDQFEHAGGWATVPRCTGHVGGALAPMLAPSVKLGAARLALVAFKRPAIHLSVEF